MALIGMSVRSPEVINNVSFLVLFPLTFISNAFVPSDTLPTPLRLFAEYNPVSALVQAARELFGNVPPGTPVAEAWTAAESDPHRADRHRGAAARVRAALDPQVLPDQFALSRALPRLTTGRVSRAGRAVR